MAAVTRDQFVRWANRREDAANALRGARLAMETMSNISGPGSVRDAVDEAWLSAGRAITELGNALDVASRESPPAGAAK